MADKIVPLALSKGSRGRFKYSELEFEVIETTSDTSTIKIKPWNTVITVKDVELRQNAVGITSA